ncbi:MAG: zinc ribbon domain-containing protein [Nitrospiraceae bacterium]|nr:zinc ribbon domain-containing protein [Nitrospiraceae bacterium]
MPVYEYICNSCGEKFSLFQSMSAGGKGSPCPKCASQDTKKIISSFCCSTAGGGASSSGHSHGSGGG